MTNRILYFDIEKSPHLVWTHYIGSKVSINPCQIEEYGKIICISYNFSDDDPDNVKHLTWNRRTQDDTAMLTKFNNIAKEADMLLGHNGQNYDVKEIRTSIALRGLGRKESTSFELWIDVAKGDLGALDRMVSYCDQDVRLLRKIHERLEPYVLPTVGEQKLKKMGHSCYPNECKECHHKNKGLFIKYGRYTYKKNDYQKYLCKVCNTVNMPEKDAEENGKGNRL